MRTNARPATWDEDIAALSRAKFYLVSRLGPLLFKLRASDSELIYTINISTPFHECTCGGGRAKGTLCLHILFIILKMLKVPCSNPLAWQPSWSENEIDRILSGAFVRNATTSQRIAHAFLKKGDGAKSLRKEDDSIEEKESEAVDTAPVIQRDIDHVACSICQDEMTESELDADKLCYCEGSCGSSFHKACMRIFAAHSKVERKAVLCPLCRGPWTAPLVDNATCDEKKPSGRMRLPRLKCHHCRFSIRTKEFVRCSSCPSYDVCYSCFQRGASASHDPSHCLFIGELNQYPTQWRAVSARRKSRREEVEALSLLQYRDLSPSDYMELLSLDDTSSACIPLHEHLVNSLPDVDTQDTAAGGICVSCSVSLGVDRKAKQLPCQCRLHRTCVISHLLSALYSGGGAVGEITCPQCPKDAPLFPSLLREPETRPAKKLSALKCKPGPGKRDVDGGTTMVQLSITGITNKEPSKHTFNSQKSLSASCASSSMSGRNKDVEQDLSMLAISSSIETKAEKETREQLHQKKAKQITSQRARSMLSIHKKVAVPSELSSILHVAGNQMSETIQ